LSIPTEDILLNTARRSAELVGRHDRAGWIDLFEADGTIEDPVGSAPHTGRGSIGRFYDTFIGPRDITFRVHADYVGAGAVVRDVTLDVVLGPRVRLQIPAILLYRMSTAGPEPKIAALQAYWELPPMVWQFIKNGPAALPAGMALAAALLRNQRVVGTLGFLAGFRRTSGRERQLLEHLLTALDRGDELAIRRILGQGALLDIGVDDLARRVRNARWDKIICAGRSVVTSVHGPHGDGVVIVDFTPTGVLRRLRYFGQPHILA